MYEIEITDCTAQAEMKNSIFQNIIEELNESNSDQIIGDPLTPRARS